MRVERGSLVVERRTRNQVSPGSNPHLVPFRRLGSFVLSIDTPVYSAEYNSWLIDSGGNVSDLVLARNCCLARMLPTVGIRMNRSVSDGKSVKRFERPTDWILRYIKTTFKYNIDIFMIH